MSYIGSTPTTQSFIAGTDYFNGTGSATAFTLSRSVVSANDIQATVNNVVQVPNDAYTVNGTTITFTSAPSAGTNNIYVRYLSTTTQSITPSQGTVSWSTLNADVQQDLGISFKNRVFNGACVIDQRNNGASITQDTSGTQYSLDRWSDYGSVSSKFTVQQNAGSVTPPTGFTYYLGVTSSSAYAVGSSDIFTIQQRLEGYNVADLAFGTANAKTITVSFWVRSSLTGTFGGAINNVDATRSYPFTYTISAANTWTQISITVAGDTSGTWNTTNGVGLRVTFGMGCGATVSGTAGAWATASYFSATSAVSVVGTSGATWYITGLQLEVGTQATTFDYRSYGTELALCQRYFEKSYNQNEAVGASGVLAFRVYVTPFVGNEYSASLYFKVSKRTAPTMAYYTNGGTPNVWVALPSASNRTPTTNTVGENSFEISVASVTADSTLQGSWTASAEL